MKSEKTLQDEGAAAPPASLPEVIETIRTELGRIRYGSVSITIHDGKIVQLDVTEKTRLF